MNKEEFLALSIREKLDYALQFEPYWGDRTYGHYSFYLEDNTEVNFDFFDNGKEDQTWIEGLTVRP